MLGLLREEEGLGARTLNSLDIHTEEVRAQVARIVGLGDSAMTGQIPFTPRAKKILELSLREALSLGHNYVGTEHLLLGLVRENEGVAVRILLDFDATAEKIRESIIRMLSGPSRKEQLALDPVFALKEAVKEVLPYLQLSTEDDFSYTGYHENLSPAQALRFEAQKIEKKDRAIKKLRSALKEA